MKISNIIIFLNIIIIVIYNSFTFSQCKLEWVVYYNGQSNGDDKLTGLTADQKGYVYATGISYDSNTKEDWLTVKYDCTGKLLKQVPIRYTKHDSPQYMMSNDKNIYIIGNIRVDQNDYRDFLALKYNQYLGQMWFYQSSLNDSNIVKSETIGVQITTDILENIYILCRKDKKFLTYKFLKDNLIPQWVKMYTSSQISGYEQDVPQSLNVTKLSNVYVNGYFHFKSTTGIVLTKYNSSGDIIWTNYLMNDTAKTNPCGNFILDNEENAYICGVTSNIRDTFGTLITYRINNNNTEKWKTTFSPKKGFAESKSIGMDYSEQIYSACNAIDSNRMTEFLVIKYDNESGKEVWKQTLKTGINRSSDTGMTYQGLQGMKIDDSGIYLYGYVRGKTSKTDILIVKYDFNGYLVWEKTFEGETGADDEIVMLFVKDNNIYLGGNSKRNNGFDYFIVKYSEIP